MGGLRRLAVPIGIVAAVLLVALFNPWVKVDEGTTLREVLTIAFWVSFTLLLVALFEDRKEPEAAVVEIEGPRFVRFLFSNTRAGLFWLPIRLFLGFAWLDAGWHKFSGTGWMDGGAALAGFWKGAVAVPEQGRPPISYEWYRDFINFLLAGHHETWFAPLITFGELAVGVGLLLGALTGLAAFGGALMNMSFLLAGSASTNPVLFTMAIGLILAWKVAGWYGLDRYLLPALGRALAARPGARWTARDQRPRLTWPWGGRRILATGSAASSSRPTSGPSRSSRRRGRSTSPRTHGAQLLIVSVIDPAEMSVDAVAVPQRGRAATAPRWDQVRDVRRDAAQRLVERGREAGVPATFMVWTGDPGSSIVAAAAAEQADLVVVGSHGRGRLGRMVMGSVSDHVARQAGCPVLVVRGQGRPD